MSGLELIGPLVAGLGTIVSGVAEKNAADFEAEQLRAKGKEEFAAAQRDALDKRREGNLIASRQQALAAASGGGADDPTIVKLMTDTVQQADYNARTAMYGGEQRKRGLFDQARGRKMSGRASLLGSVFGGFGQAAKAFG